MLRALTLLYFELLIFKLSSPPAGLPSSRLFQDLLLPHPHHLQWLYKWIIIITENTHFATCSALRESHALFHVTLQQALEGKAIWPYLHILKLRSREAKWALMAIWDEYGSSAQEPKHGKLFCDALASSSRQCWLPRTVPKCSELGRLKMWSVPHQMHVHGVV